MNESLKTLIVAIIGIAIGAISAYLGLQQAIEKTTDVIHRSGELQGELNAMSSSIALAKEKAAKLESDVTRLQTTVTGLSKDEALDLARVANEFKDKPLKETLYNLSRKLSEQPEISISTISILATNFSAYETKLLTLPRVKRIENISATSILWISGGGHAELIFTISEIAEEFVKVYIHNPRSSAWKMAQVNLRILNIKGA